MKRFITIFFSLILLFQHGSTQSKQVGIGDNIPAFSLQDQDGNIFNSRDYSGKNILVIYFYPKDESSVCTKEACSFRDNYTDFTKAGVIVIGINQASVETHKKFQSHHHLPF